MDLQHARFLADSVVAKLAPFCKRVVICGGIRRHKTDPHDIDLVVEPQRDLIKDMFGTITGTQVIPEFITAVNQWTKIKGEPTGRYTQRLLKDGTKLEISITTKENWGNITLIRTGDREFTELVMKRALSLGFNQRDGYLWDEDKRIPLFNEKDYFKILNLPFIEPEKRDINAFKYLKNVY